REAEGGRPVVAGRGGGGGGGARARPGGGGGGAPPPRDVAERLGPTGIDRVECLIAANPGEPMLPLARVASGGELSRVMLALKLATADADAVATYVFDEVDAGVGGGVAEKIGRLVREVAHHRQVPCITHLPPIAAFAHVPPRGEKKSGG